MKNTKILLMLAAGLVLAGCDGSSSDPTQGVNYPTRETTDVTVNKADIRDKVMGGWVGHNIGMGSGYEYIRTTDNWSETESKKIDGQTVEGKNAIFALDDRYWEPNGKVCSGSIGCNELKVRPVNDARVTKSTVYSDDDCHVDLFNQFIFRDYGPTLGNNDIAKAWDFYDVHDVGGGEPAKNLISNGGYIAPYCGQSTYGNFQYLITESWIENETLGMDFPYMLDTALGYADMFTQVQGDAYAYYLGKQCAMMYALAYQYDDARVCLEKSFDFIPRNNELYPMYQMVKKYHDQGVSWRRTAIEVVKKSTNVTKVGIRDAAGFSLTGNAGMIYLGIIYGDNDYEKSLKITSLAALDGDCTAATVGGLLGMIKGYSGTPEKYRNYLGPSSTYYNYTGSNSGSVGVSWGPFAYMGANFPNSMTFDQIADLYVENIEAQIVDKGGSINSDGTYTIKDQGYHPVEQVATTNFTFESGTTDGWQFESSSEEDTFAASKSGTHIGTYGGVISLADPLDTAKAYQTINVTKGNSYKLTAWVNKANDREYRLFAAEGDKVTYRSYTNPISNGRYFMKGELYFTATSNAVDVGIELPSTFEDVTSTIFSFDDLIVSDVTRTMTKKDYKSFQCETLNKTGSAEVVSGAKYSGGKAVKLYGDDSITFPVTGNGEVQSIRIYYENYINNMATVSFKLDGRLVCNIPLTSTGVNSAFNAGNYAKADMYLGRGEHTVELTYCSFDELVVDQIDIVNASALLER